MFIWGCVSLNTLVDLWLVLEMGSRATLWIVMWMYTRCCAFCFFLSFRSCFLVFHMLGQAAGQLYLCPLQFPENKFGNEKWEYKNAYKWQWIFCIIQSCLNLFSNKFIFLFLHYMFRLTQYWMKISPCCIIISCGKKALRLRRPYNILTRL